MAKKGRKRSNYTTSWGETIDGLGCLADGRWVDLDDRKHPWTSNDEREAIREFHRRRSKRKGETIRITTKKGDRWDLADMIEVLERVDDLQPIVNIDDEAGTVAAEIYPPSNAIWDAVGKLIRERPKLAAEKTGIKELAWLEDLEEPPPPLKLKDIGELYKQKKFTDPNEARKSELYWNEFCSAVAPATTIKEIKPEHLKQYLDAVNAMGLSAKTIKNRYAKIGSMLKYAHDLKPAHRVAIQNLKTEFNRICKSKRKQQSVAEPIDPADYTLLYEAADLRWRAILLCMLNFAMHPKEAGELRKNELNFKQLELRSSRTKTGVLRVAKIWPETATAIRAYQKTQQNNEKYQKSPQLFLTAFAKQYSYGGLTQYFRNTLKPRAEKLAKRKLNCTLDSLRDGAQNAADDGGADTIHTEMLMGHALPGVMGHYKKRTPKKTEMSVRCIHEHYNIGKLVKEAK